MGVVILCALTVLGTGCTTIRETSLEQRYRRDIARCVPRPPWPPSNPQHLEPELSADHRAVLETVAPDLRRVVHAGRLEHALAQLLLERQSRGLAYTPLESVSEFILIQDRLRALSVEITAAGVEIDCLGDRLESLGSSLHQRRAEREVRLTVWSIAIGALAGIAAGVWDLRARDSDGPAWVAITGGTIAAGLGIAGLATPKYEVWIEHERNPLLPVWTGSDPDRIFGTFSWRMLNSVPPQSEQTPRERLVESWKELVSRTVADDRIPPLRDLLLGRGGRYDLTSLAIREAMLDSLESELEGLHRELERVSRYMSRMDAALTPEDSGMLETDSELRGR